MRAVLMVGREDVVVSGGIGSETWAEMFELLE
jgi:hypothetical protein